MIDKLKFVPCGCGGEAVLETDHDIIQPVVPIDWKRVRCNKCNIRTTWHKSEAEAIEAWNEAMRNVNECAKDARCNERKRTFLGIDVSYPTICTYPEYEGKPYYAIKFEENGETIVGFGTYKPEVLSQYLQEYFIPSAEPERKKGCWEPVTNGRGGHQCDRCGCYAPSYQSGTEWLSDFCPNCDADMRGE